MIATTCPLAVPATTACGTARVIVFDPLRPHAAHSWVYVVIGRTALPVSVAQYSIVISLAASVGHIVTNVTVVVVVVVVFAVPFVGEEEPPIAGAGGGISSSTLP